VPDVNIKSKLKKMATEVAEVSAGHLGSDTTVPNLVAGEAVG
jgi:hypothetical protein